MKFRCAAALAAVAIVVLGASPAAAAVTLRDVDAHQFPRVSMSILVDGAAPRLADFHLRENGRVVDSFDVTPLAQTGTTVGTVLVIDTSGSMNDAGKLEAAKGAARQFVGQKLANDVIAIVAFGDTSRVVADFTADADALRRGIDSLRASGETALWDAVRVGAGLFASHPALQANVLLLSDGKNSIPGVTLDQARDAAMKARAAVFAVDLGDAGGDAAAMTALANATGGRFVSAEAKALGAVYDGISRSLRNQYRIQYTSSASGSRVAVEVTAGSERASGAFDAPAARANAPAAAPRTSSPSFVHGTPGLILAGLLVFGAAALGLLAIAQFAFPGRPKMASMISAYGDPAEALTSDSPRHVQLAETTFVQRAVEATAKLAGERGFLAGIERTLQQADAPVRAAEAFFFTNAAVVVAGILVYATIGALVPTLATLVLGGLTPPMYLKFRIARRKRKFLTQLPDTLQLLAGSLRAGYSLMQGVETVAQEIHGPMGRELQIVLTETKLGRPLEEALEDAAHRLGSPDFDWVVMAIGIQREVGGNLAELLSTVAETMIARQRLRREVRALTAEGRMTATILGLLPIAIGIALWVLNPTYLEVMFNRSIGKIVLGASTVWAVLGFFWMKKIISVEA